MRVTFSPVWSETPVSEAGPAKVCCFCMGKVNIGRQEDNRPSIIGICRSAAAAASGLCVTIIRVARRWEAIF